VFDVEGFDVKRPAQPVMKTDAIRQTLIEQTAINID
jgi:hypothetical protein